MARASKGPGWVLAWLLAAASATAFPEAWARGERVAGLYLAARDLPPMRVACVPAGADRDGLALAACVATDGLRTVFLVCDPWECAEP